ncbi:hypothetical protein PVAP13_9NG426128 [Panicum virgatum]|uniref:Uncharacterized protein n=1 Tax=Panicum virgatum TaxID=38727 RepID=A0A8T0MMI5_PANVG|nr:hypothetical protein PVAP13_9NG426128 [Panicum virgatum]
MWSAEWGPLASQSQASHRHSRYIPQDRHRCQGSSPPVRPPLRCALPSKALPLRHALPSVAPPLRRALPSIAPPLRGSPSLCLLPSGAARYHGSSPLARRPSIPWNAGIIDWWAPRLVFPLFLA